jgi:hypothetical protein
VRNHETLLRLNALHFVEAVSQFQDLVLDQVNAACSLLLVKTRVKQLSIQVLELLKRAKHILLIVHDILEVNALFN